jgi:hypothetical protein
MIGFYPELMPGDRQKYDLHGWFYDGSVKRIIVRNPSIFEGTAVE